MSPGVCAQVFAVSSERERAVVTEMNQLSFPSSSNMSHPKTPVSGDLRVHNGEELQLTTTITHVDGPTEIYKLTRKEAQE